MYDLYVCLFGDLLLVRHGALQGQQTLLPLLHLLNKKIITISKPNVLVTVLPNINQINLNNKVSSKGRFLWQF